MSGLRRTRHRLRRTLGLAVACVTAATAAACSSSGTTADNGGSAKSGTVNWWGWSPSAQAAKAAITAFNHITACSAASVSERVRSVPSGRPAVSRSWL